MLLPHLSDLKFFSVQTCIPAILFLSAFISHTKATESQTQVSLWNIEKLEVCLSKSKAFEAEKYQQSEYSNLLEKSKEFLALPNGHVSYSDLSKKLEISCINLILSASQKHFDEEFSLLLNKLQTAESAYAEVLARTQFVQGKQIYNESLLIRTDLQSNQKSFAQTPIWSSSFDTFLGELENLESKLQKGKEFSQKAIQLSLSQAEQLINAVLDTERTINYILQTETNPELIEKLPNYKTELTASISQIQAGEIKMGYMKAEKIRIELGEFLSKFLAPKFEKESQSLTERLEKLEKIFSEITPHPEDSNFHADYIHSKDTLGAIQESLRQAKELSSMERFGEALEILEEGFQLASLIEEDLPALKRKQSHIIKEHSKGISKETQKFDPSEKVPKKKDVEYSIYITKPKDTLSGIAKKLYGKQSLWKRIHKSNPKIQNPDLIYPKQRLKLPKK